MGSKRRLAKHILPIILKDRKPNQWYVEPFVGGANMIDKVDGRRMGADLNSYLIKALRLIRDNPESIPDIITEDDYNNARINRSNDGLTGFIGFAMSFGGKWFGGYRRDVAGTKGSIENMETQTRRSKQDAIRQSKKLKGVVLIAESYQRLRIPQNSIIYCDPPYANATKYSTSDFDHDAFWQWCREKSMEGHRVFISEYSAPDDFECVWQMEIHSSLTKDTGSKKGIEKLFVYKGSNQE